MNNGAAGLIVIGLLVGAVSASIESPDLRIVLFLAAMALLIGGIFSSRYPPPKQKNDEQ